MTGGNWLFKDQDGKTLFTRNRNRIHLTNYTQIGSNNSLDGTYKLIATVVTHLHSFIKGDTKIYILGIPPRFFYLCCDNRNHMPIDFDGEHANMKIRNLNAYIGKRINSTYTNGHRKVYYVNPTSYLSPIAYQGLTPSGDHLLLDQVHLSGSANDAAIRSILAMVYDDSTDLLFVNENVEDLPPSFMDNCNFYDPAELHEVGLPPS